jgi:3-deoxy-D-manno-octulosonate 8-phosphate phosphatase (KDO 8-P phosphatase)
VTKIKAVALDVDGVLTDGSFVWGTDGEEFKRFSFRDVMGISLAMKAGILFALVSGEATPQVERYAAKMGIADVHTGCKDKASALRTFADSHGLALQDVCFIGDDVNDLPAIALAGLGAAPADAHQSVLREADYVATASGGNGAVREILDYIMNDHSASRRR